MHAHEMRVISLTLDGPLKLLTGCALCAKTEVLEPTPRKRKVPAGVTPELWAALCTKDEAELESLRERIYRRLCEVFPPSKRPSSAPSSSPG